MIESSKNTREIIPENAFEHKRKKPGLSANRPSNNRAQGPVARRPISANPNLQSGLLLPFAGYADRPGVRF